MDTTQTNAQDHQQPAANTNAQRHSESGLSSSKLDIERSDHKEQVKESSTSFILVTAVDSLSGEYLSEAEILVSNPAYAAWRQLREESTSTEELMEVLDNRQPEYFFYTVNAQGVAQISRPEGQFKLAGRSSTHFRRGESYDPAIKKITMSLQPISSLKVLVRDDAGRPAVGTSVFLFKKAEFSADLLLKKTTDSKGEVEFSKIPLHANPFERTVLHVEVGAVAREAISKAIGWPNVPTETVEVITPQTGVLEVVVLNSKGKPVVPRFDVSLEVMDKNVATTPFELLAGSWSPSNSLRAKTYQGKAIYRHVEIQQELKIIAISPNEELRASIVREGPSHSGAKVVVTLTPILDQPILVGRILNTEGKVGKRKGLDVLIERDGSRSYRDSLTTDGKGFFRFLLKEKFKEGTRFTLQLTLAATERNPQRFATADLSNMMSPGEHDLGDLVLQVSPLLAQGKVVDALGNPVPDAYVLLEVKKAADASLPGSGYWDSYFGLKDRTNGSGEFTIRGAAEGQQFRVAAKSKNKIKATQEISLGQTGVLVQLGRAQTLRGRFLLDPEIDPTLLSVKIINPWQGEETSSFGGFGKAKSSRPVQLGADGHFVVPGQIPGQAKLVLEADLLGNELFSFAPLVISSAQGDQVLEDVDLRGELISSSLTVVDHTGEIVTAANVGYQMDFWLNPVDRQPFVFVSRGPVPNLSVRAKGWRNLTVENLSQDRQVVMQKGIPVRIILDNAALVPKGYQVNAALLLQGDGEEALLSMFDEVRLENMHQGARTADLKQPGAYQVCFQFRRIEPSHAPSTVPLFVAAAAAPPPEGEVRQWPVIHVKDLASMQEFHVVMNERALEKLAELVKNDQ